MLYLAQIYAQSGAKIYLYGASLPLLSSINLLTYWLWLLLKGVDNEMDEKILGEIRFIETEDGFRMEIKGDKEKLRKMGFGSGWPGGGFGPGPEFNRGPHGRRRDWHRGPWKHGHFGGFGPWMWGWNCWTGEREDEAGDEPPKEA